MNRHPIVLCIGGHDPTGGAGIQADIETVNALGGRAVSLVTALTAQDSHNVSAVLPTPVSAFSQQFDTLVDDIAPDAVKIGLLGSIEQIADLAARLTALSLPVILDPVLAAGGGYAMDRNGLSAAIRVQLLPITTLLTPNRAEARRLAGRQTTAASAWALLEAGAQAVLVTGADEAAEQGEAEVVNRLYRGGTPPTDFAWPRLPHRYHGSGCTLASACATYLASGRQLDEAVAAAQAFVARALEQAEAAGRGQLLPRRQP